MQYRHIEVKDIRNLPEHINLLRNLQDMHAALVKITDEFPTLELVNVIPNYENRYNNLTIKANKIISKFKVNSILYKVDIDFTIGGSSAEKLLTRKDGLVKVLEIAVDRWQSVCDQIEKIEQAAAEEEE